jgi:Flp pilus assembly protein TadB
MDFRLKTLKLMNVIGPKQLHMFTLLKLRNKIIALSLYAILVFIFIAVSYNISIFAGGWALIRILDISLLPLCRLIISSEAHGKTMRIVMQIPWFLSLISTTLHTLETSGAGFVVKLVKCKKCKKQ